MFVSIMSTGVGNAGPYTYTAIKPDHFRIIEIHSLEPEIRIKLVERPDQSPPEYFALSYCWGTENNTEHILCDEKAFAITPNLKEGLKSIYHACGSFRLWVDAICIDQESDAEKEAQVAKMHEIYRKARGVYVWLGASENDSDAAIDAIKEVNLNDTSRDKPLGEALLMHKSGATRIFTMDLFKPVAALSRRAWFRRLWIAQEYFHAQSVQFLCGSSMIDGSHLIKVLNNLSINSFGDVDPPDMETEQDLFVGYHTLRELDELKTKHAQSTEPIFYASVILNRERFGKEPVDKIYAAFGMVHGADSVYRNGIHIDYSEGAKSNYWRLYTTFGKIALQHEPHLQLLSTVSSKERPDRLPSWCPNLNSTAVTSELDSVHVYAAGWPYEEHETMNGSEGVELPPCMRHSNFKGKTENHVLVHPDSDTVSIWGASLGCITAIGAKCEWNADVDMDSLKSIKSLAKGFLKWFYKHEQFYKQHCKDESTAFHVQDEVLVGATNKTRRARGLKRDDDTDIWSLPASKTLNYTEVEKQSDTAEARSPKNCKSSTESKEASIVAMPGQINEHCESESRTRDRKMESGDNSLTKKDYQRDKATLFSLGVLFQMLELNKDDDDRIRDPVLLQNFEAVYTWIMFLFETWHHRVPFVTGNGHFGYASEDLKVGDHVCMLYGGRTLFVLRRGVKDYSFVSDAFVLDCVNGEVFEMLDEGVVKEELLHIS